MKTPTLSWISFSTLLVSILGIKKFHISTFTLAIILKIQIKKYFLFYFLTFLATKQCNKYKEMPFQAQNFPGISKATVCHRRHRRHFEGRFVNWGHGEAIYEQCVFQDGIDGGFNGGNNCQVVLRYWGGSEDDIAGEGMRCSEFPAGSRGFDGGEERRWESLGSKWALFKVLKFSTLLFKFLWLFTKKIIPRKNIRVYLVTVFPPYFLFSKIIFYF